MSRSFLLYFIEVLSKRKGKVPFSIIWPLWIPAMKKTMHSEALWYGGRNSFWTYHIIGIAQSFTVGHIGLPSPAFPWEQILIRCFSSILNTCQEVSRFGLQHTCPGEQARYPRSFKKEFCRFIRTWVCWVAWTKTTPMLFQNISSA